MSAFGMLLQGKVGDAIVRVIETVLGVVLPKPLAELVHRLTDDEGKILWDAASTALGDLVGGKSFTQVVDDVWDTIKEQVPSKAKADLADALGIQSRSI